MNPTQPTPNVLSPQIEQALEARANDRMALHIGRLVLAGFADRHALERIDQMLGEANKKLADALTKIQALEAEKKDDEPYIDPDIEEPVPGSVDE